MPQALLLSYLTMEPRLRARRQLESVRAYRAAQAEQKSYEAYTEALEDEIGERRLKHVATNPDDEALAFMGIAVEYIESGGGAE